MLQTRSAVTRVQAAVIIVIIVFAAVAGAYYYVSRTARPTSTTPPVQPIIFGILGPITAIQGIGMEQGAEMAAKQINDSGGILGRPIKLVFEDTDEADPSIPVDTALSAMNKIVTVDNAGVIIGGFRSDVVLAEEDKLATYKVPFIDVGAADTSMTAKVLSDYSTYKYFFRINPVNSTSLAISLIQFYGYFHAVTHFTKVYILAEDAAWTHTLSGVLQSVLPKLGWTIVSPGGQADYYPLSATDFSVQLSRVRSSGAQALLMLVSAGTSIPLMQQWSTLQVPALPAGIDVAGQLGNFWNQTNGGAKYEINLLGPAYAGTRLNAETTAFYKNFTTLYHSLPVYTAPGAYEAVYVVAQAIERAGGSLNLDTLVTQLEMTNYTGVGGHIVFDKSHDVIYGANYAPTVMCQWVGYNDRTTVWSLVPGVATKIQFPPWMTAS